MIGSIVNIFVAGSDKICPIAGNELIDLFTTHAKPIQMTYKKWDHMDFVKGAELELLVEDIGKAIVVRNRRSDRKSLAEMYPDIANNTEYGGLRPDEL